MWRGLASTLVVCLLGASATARETAHRESMAEPIVRSSAPPVLSETVLPLTELKFGMGVHADFGTGFCLDLECRFVGTNYHVAALAEPKKIKGQIVVRRYLATGADDEGATLNQVASMGRVKYRLDRDLAIFELRHPLRGHH